MRRIVFFLTAFMMVQDAVSGQNPSTIQVSSPEFAKIVVEDIGVLLDVRTMREFQNGHIANAGNLNYYAFDFRRRLLLLPKDQPIYLYCNTGYRSDRAADFLIRNGYERVYNLQHGIMEWDLHDLPVAIDPNAQPDMDDKFEPSDFAGLIENEPVVFVDFYAPWCGPCRQMMPMIDSLKTEYHERIPVIKVNADASKRLMRELKLVTVPYLVLYRNGELVFDHKGIMKREEVVSLLESNLPYTKKP
jgi:thioredoxin 1